MSNIRFGRIFNSKESFHQVRKLLRRVETPNWKNFPPKAAEIIKKYPCSFLGLGFGTTSTYFLYRWIQNHNLQEEFRCKKRSSEVTFLRFASMEYNGQAYMTPMDFLDSVLESNPRIRRTRRIILTDETLKEIKKKTPSQKENSPQFFRTLNNSGIIAYTDYLFLLSVLIKPNSAFEISFKMLDTNRNGIIEKKEYLIMERIFSRNWKLRRGLQLKEFSEDLVDDECGLQRKKSIDTTLTIHFFGKDGTQVLTYDNFRRFLLNLQREILELEFAQLSHGLPYITEIDFAKFLIRYTYMDQDYDYDNYVDRLLQRRGHRGLQEGVTFEEFRNFSNFLNNIEDFYIAVKFHSQLRPTVTRLNFYDAFKLVGEYNLSWHLIDTLFNIFDVDGSGLIVYQDFVRVMNARLYRGFRKQRRRSSWMLFRRCVKRASDRDPDIKFYNERKMKLKTVNKA